MKKYLMTGMAAIAFCAAFTSCSKNDDLYDPKAIEEMEMAQNYEAYNQAFIATFGQVNPNQDWGFGSRARTRGENANANEWADPNKAYGGLIVPPPLNAKQIAVVKKYFQTHPNLGYQDPGWSNYFIQQVYKGHTDVPEGCATPEQYLAANGSTYIIASDHMDHLIAVDPEKGITDHINNFNHGDCGETNVLKNGGNANDGPFYKDKIMYMQNSTTKSFGYHNSDGSLYHTNYTGLVSYTTIMAEMGAEADCLDDGWKRSFMGFDFEQMVGSSVYKAILDYSGGYVQPQDRVAGVEYVDGFRVIGYETFEFEGNTYNFLSANGNMYAADKNDDSYVGKKGSYSTTPGKANWNDKPSDDIIRELLSKGYLPYSDTLKDWVKVGGTADGYFSDWIVTLTEAKTDNTPDPTVVRIMAEDLNAKAYGPSDYINGEENESDWDFNDVVFDVKFDATGNGGTVTLICAGGVLPLYVDGNEVHKMFDPNLQPDEKGYYPMINTGAGPNYPRVSFPVANADKEHNGQAISIVVHKQHADGTWHEYPLTAQQGKPAAKFAVKNTVQPLGERVHINTASGGAFGRAVNSGQSPLDFIWW
jgi:hypothetical protein